MDTTIEMTGRLVPRAAWTAENCSVVRALEIVRNRATVVILREAFYGATRFEEFAERAGLSEPVTAARLRELTDAEILRREPYQEPGQRTRHAYLLTEKGADLLTVVVALMQWGDRWMQENGAPVELHHRDCDGRVGVELRCEHDHPVSGERLRLALNPAYRRPRPPA